MDVSANQKQENMLKLVVRQSTWKLADIQPDSTTHHWKVQLIISSTSVISQNVISSVKFLLHESYAIPERVVTEPPFEVSENGHSNFYMKIMINFVNTGMINGSLSQIISPSIKMNFYLEIPEIAHQPTIINSNRKYKVISLLLPICKMPSEEPNKDKPQEEPLENEYEVKNELIESEVEQFLQMNLNNESEDSSDECKSTSSFIDQYVALLAFNCIYSVEGVQRFNKNVAETEVEENPMEEDENEEDMEDELYPFSTTKIEPNQFASWLCENDEPRDFGNGYDLLNNGLNSLYSEYGMNVFERINTANISDDESPVDDLSLNFKEFDKIEKLRKIAVTRRKQQLMEDEDKDEHKSPN